MKMQFINNNLIGIFNAIIIWIKIIIKKSKKHNFKTFKQKKKINLKIKVFKVFQEFKVNNILNSFQKMKSVYKINYKICSKKKKNMENNQN